MATATKSKVKIRPLANQVVLRPIEETEEMRGGLYIPDTAKEKPQQGSVVAVGPGELTDDGSRVPVEVEEGDRVLYKKYAGTEVTVDGEEFLIVEGDGILAVIEE